MMYEDVIRDFAERTQANLRAIEKLQESGKTVYEVTQLVNSMLGLLVFPREEFVDRIPATPLPELAADGWPVPEISGRFSPPADLQELIRYLRNAIAHFNVNFLGDQDDRIQGLRLWNSVPGREKKTWEAEFKLRELRSIAERFVALVLAETGHSRGRDNE